MLYAFHPLLCLKLCQHKRLKPALGYKFHRSLCLKCYYYLHYLTISHDSAGEYIHFLLWYCSDVKSHSLAILSLDSRNLSLFSRQLSVRVCRKSARVEPSVELQITALKYRFTRLAWGLDWITGQFNLHLSSGWVKLTCIDSFPSLVCTCARNCWTTDWSRTIFQAISSHARVTPFSYQENIPSVKV